MKYRELGEDSVVGREEGAMRRQPASDIPGLERTNFFKQTFLFIYIPTVRDAIIEYPTRGPTYQGNIGHRNYLIFRMKMSLKKLVMTFLASIYQFYLHFVKIRPK